MSDVKYENGQYICPYNDQCRCDQMKCSRCGWNPVVAQQRLQAILREWRL
jgi:hypothetical protein